MQDDSDNKFLNSLKERLFEKFQKIREKELEIRKKKMDFHKFEYEDENKNQSQKLLMSAIED